MMEKFKVCRGVPKFISPSPLSHSPPSRSLSPTIPSYPCNSAFELCPSLVKIYVETESGKHVSDFGFVAHREDDITTIWGCSWFLYEDEPYEVNGEKKLVHGEVFVSSDHPDFGGTFKGLVAYVNFVHDLVVIKCKTPHNDLPSARLCGLNPSTMYKESFICLDYYSYLDRYVVVTTYKFRAVYCQEKKLVRPHRHFDRGVQSYQGVILNANLDIVGFKMRACESDDTLAHVLPMDRVSKYLSSYTYSSRGCNLNLDDIRNSLKENMNIYNNGRIAELKREVESLKICLRQSEKKLEIALKEAPQVEQEFEASTS